jgi:hypothetical protein
MRDSIRNWKDSTANTQQKSNKISSEERPSKFHFHSKILIFFKMFILLKLKNKKITKKN